MTAEQIRKVERAAVKYGAAREALHAAIREAYAAGASLLAIAEAAGVSKPPSKGRNCGVRAVTRRPHLWIEEAIEASGLNQPWAISGSSRFRTRRPSR